MTQERIAELIEVGYAAGQGLRATVAAVFSGDERAVYTEALVAGLYGTDCRVKDIELLLDGDVTGR